MPVVNIGGGMGGYGWGPPPPGYGSGYGGGSSGSGGSSGAGGGASFEPDYQAWTSNFGGAGGGNQWATDMYSNQAANLNTSVGSANLYSAVANSIGNYMLEGLLGTAEVGREGLNLAEQTSPKVTGVYENEKNNRKVHTSYCYDYVTGEAMDCGYYNASGSCPPGSFLTEDGGCSDSSYSDDKKGIEPGTHPTEWSL